MSYIFTPALKHERARLILERLFTDDKKERLTEGALLLLLVFGGGYMSFLLADPAGLKAALTAGLACTSVASIARTAVAGTPVRAILAPAPIAPTEPHGPTGGPKKTGTQKTSKQ